MTRVHCFKLGLLVLDLFAANLGSSPARSSEQVITQSIQVDSHVAEIALVLHERDHHALGAAADGARHVDVCGGEAAGGQDEAGELWQAAGELKEGRAGEGIVWLS